MLKLKYLLAFLGAFLSIEANQQQPKTIISKKFHCNLLCNDGYVIDFETCLCKNAVSHGKERKLRSIDSAYVSKSKRSTEIASHSSNNQCRYDDVWNGSACIPLNSLCPGGYHWNGHVCIIQSTRHTAALVPLEPNTKCKYAIQADEVTTNNPEPVTVMPTIITSPMCPFGHVWSNNKCIRNPPACPDGYYYSGGVCRLKPQQTQQTTTETSVHQHLPTINDVLWQNHNNGDKWLQKPLGSELRYVSTTPKTENAQQNQQNTFDNVNLFTNDRNQQTCCSVMSPRLCRHISNNTHEIQWQCYHHEYRRCDDFCTKPRIFLRPKKSTFNEPILMMPPPPPQLLRLIQVNTHREINIGNNKFNKQKL